MTVDIVSEFFRCETDYSTEVAVEYAKFLHHEKINNENYPIFMELVCHENPNVINAILGEESDDDETYFSVVQPNAFLIKKCFENLSNSSPNRLNSRTLTVVLGLLRRNYDDARQGVELCPLTFEHLNTLGKYLDKSAQQSELTNRILLDIFANISELSSLVGLDPEMEKMVAYANRIRNAFFDRRVELESVLPSELFREAATSQSFKNPRNFRFLDQ